jgi:hypothetical protein
VSFKIDKASSGCFSSSNTTLKLLRISAADIKSCSLSSTAMQSAKISAAALKFLFL